MNAFARSGLLVTVACLSFAVFTAAQIQPKQSGTHNIAGYLRIGNRAAPPGVLVQITGDDGGGALDQASSDAAGRFEFHDLLPGIYVVTARYPGCRDASEQVDLRFSPSASVQLQLVPVAGNESPAVSPASSTEMISAKVPKKREARKALGQGEILLFQKKDATASIAHFKRVITLEPDYAPGHILLGTAYVALGDWAQAESAFRAAVKLDPASASAWLGMGAVLNQTARYAEAEQALRKATSLNGTIPEGQYELGRALWAQGHSQESEPYARKALALRGNYVPAHVLLGNILLRKQDVAGALAEFEESLRLQPEGPVADQVRQVVLKLRNEKR